MDEEIWILSIDVDNNAPKALISASLPEVVEEYYFLLTSGGEDRILSESVLKLSDIERIGHWSYDNFVIKRHPDYITARGKV